MRPIEILILVIFFGSALSFGQESRGMISGRVIDPQRAAVPGATVRVTDTETNISTVFTTNQTGYYEASLLVTGNYRVSCEATGFKSSVRDKLFLPVATHLTVDFELTFGLTVETVQVTGEAPLVESSPGSSGRVVENRSIMDMPVPMSDPLTLSKLIPGAQSVVVPMSQIGADGGQ